MLERGRASDVLPFPSLVLDPCIGTRASTRSNSNPSPASGEPGAPSLPTNSVARLFDAVDHVIRRPLVQRGRRRAAAAAAARMDRLEQLGNSLSQVRLLLGPSSSTPELMARGSGGQITAYDIKSYYNAAKAAVMNYSEMETKVREATNDDPWCVPASEPASVDELTDLWTGARARP